MKPMKPNDRNVFLYRTAFIFIVVFLILIGMFYLFSLALPSLMSPCVAVVDINYPISVEGSPSSLFSSGYPSSDQVSETLRELDSRADVGAIVFVVNSGGGSFIASKEIYNEVSNLSKPSVAYFREVAASGAYHISVGTDYIISDPNCLTGSIGVITSTTSMQDLFEKIGVNNTAITSGKYKDIGSPYREMTDSERAIMQSIVDEAFMDFKSDIVKNRHDQLDMELFEQVADGRVITGRQAKRIGLVDETGTKEEAILKAAHLANISAESASDVRICLVSVMPQEGGLFSAETFIQFLEHKSSLSALKLE